MCVRPSICDTDGGEPLCLLQGEAFQVPIVPSPSRCWDNFVCQQISGPSNLCAAIFYRIVPGCSSERTAALIFPDTRNPPQVAFFAEKFTSNPIYLPPADVRRPSVPAASRSRQSITFQPRCRLRWQFRGRKVDHEIAFHLENLLTIFTLRKGKFCP